MRNNLERFTQRARRVLNLAQEEAERMHSAQIDTEHLLLALVREESGVASRTLRDVGIKLEGVLKALAALNLSVSERSEQLELSPNIKSVLEYAVDESQRMGHHYIGTEHLLLGMVRHTTGNGFEVLRLLGTSPEEIRRQTRRVLQESPIQPSTATESVSWRESIQALPLHFSITVAENPPIEFVLNFAQLGQLTHYIATALHRDETSTLYDNIHGNTYIKVTRGDTGATGESSNAEV